MVGEYMSSLWVVDEKTATRLGPSWLKSFTLRGQLLGYCYAAQKFNLPVNGFIIRGMSFLRDYYGHAEVIEAVPQYRLDQYWDQMQHDVQHMVNDWLAGRYDMSFGDACNSYGGCPYLRLCDKQDYLNWWDQYFEVNYWNPLSHQDIKEDKLVGALAS